MVVSDTPMDSGLQPVPEPEIVRLGSPVPKRILVVDDEQSNRELLEGMLEALGHQTVLADDGVDALLKLPLGFDLVLVDLLLPKMDGWAFITELRKDDQFATLPVVVLTGRTGFFDRKVKARLEHVEAYVAKPLKPLALRAIVRGLLTERHGTE
ncbi:MAG: DNA-binding response regulator [Armatimonadetes bacterium CG_4_8_14_3_um_filter_66_20]|nr:MAG: DNA-binding response regulator [Armatimonadetes bacterium CG_4_8_14_3_um_filter_66_20]